MACTPRLHVGVDTDGRCYSCGKPVRFDPAKYCATCRYAFPCQCPGNPFGTSDPNGPIPPGFYGHS